MKCISYSILIISYSILLVKWCNEDYTTLFVVCKFYQIVFLCVSDLCWKNNKSLSSTVVKVKTTPTFQPTNSRLSSEQKATRAGKH